MKRLIIGLSVFLILFLVGAIGFTYNKIQNLRQEINIQKEEIEEKEEKEESINLSGKIEKGIDLRGTYDQNDLIINKITEKYKGVEVELIQIEGLKDKEIENKINKNIYDEVYKNIKMYDKIEQIHLLEEANFSNILSIICRMKTEDEYLCTGLNYNLVTGERLEFKDIFIEGTNITDFVRETFYEYFAREMRFNKWYADDYDEDKDVISPDENDIYKVVGGYLKGRKDFAFTESDIFLYYGSHSARVDMVDIADRVSIYTKYLTEESIFEQDNIGYKNIFNCAEGYSYDEFDHIEYGYLEDNLWYDISNAFCELPEVQDAQKLESFIEFKEQIYDSVYEKINEYRSIAQSNPDTFYIIISKPRLWARDGEDSDMVEVHIEMKKYEMDRTYFDEIYIDNLIRAYRARGFIIEDGVNLYEPEEENVSFIEFDIEKLYNYVTGEEIVNSTI